MKLIHNILSSSDRPWAVQAAGQFFHNFFFEHPKKKLQKERALAAGEKNPVHYARQLAERLNPLRLHRSTPLPCYGRRFFSFTPHVSDMTLTTCEIQRLLQWQNATMSADGTPCNLLFSFLCFVSFFFSGRRKKERNEGKKAYYGYNAGNTRAYKLGLSGSSQWVNGQSQPLDLHIQHAMFYPNAYLNFNQNGEYTKHYYNGSERIASRLGSSTQPTDATSNDRLEYRLMRAEEKFRENIQELVSDGQPVDFQGTVDLNSLQPVNATSDIFYYHTNHLGSTAFVTDQNQNITQGFLYAPFGEITTEYNATFGNDIIPKYSFNAKELDEETGMYYYEARYYKPPVFTSRDPMFEKYFWISPHAYCANNPVKYVDPSGEEVGIPPFLHQIINGVKNKYNQVKSKFEDAAHEFFSTIPYASTAPLPSTINNGFEAMNVYFNGTGEPMPLSNELGNKVISTEQFQKRNQRILNGKTTSLTGNFTIDMTKEEDTFFIGRTRVDYDIKISSDKKRCTVTYTLFSNDGFWDPIDIGEDHNIGPTPDGAGPKRELPGGHPYSFKTQTRSYEFDNPGYDEK